MKTLRSIISLWKSDVSWDAKTTYEKRVIIWFAASFTTLLVVVTSWLVIPALVNLYFAAKAVSKIDMDE